jgi:hypothetical protein
MDVPNHVYSHNDDGGEDDIGENDEGPDVEKPCAILYLMCCYNVETRVSIILRHLIKCQETFFTMSVNGAIRSTQCCG